MIFTQQSIRRSSAVLSRVGSASIIASSPGKLASFYDTAGSWRACSNCSRSSRPGPCPALTTDGGSRAVMRLNCSASSIRRRAAPLQTWRNPGMGRGFAASASERAGASEDGGSTSSGTGGPKVEPGHGEKAKDRAAIGPFDLRAGLLFLATGAGLFVYFQREKKSLRAKRQEEVADARVGRPRIGGEFELLMPVIVDGKEATPHRFTHKDLEGSFSLIYFGFTNCPDICPEELDKMGVVVDRVAAEHGQIINPIFVSCDPARDNVKAVSTYVADFHPLLVGLTGTYEQVKATCKAYRVYFSTPPSADPTSDYLVDHSIFFYLMDPEGRFVDAFGRAMDADDVTTKVLGFVKRWKDEGNPVEIATAKTRVSADATRRVEPEHLPSAGR